MDGTDSGLTGSFPAPPPPPLRYGEHTEPVPKPGVSVPDKSHWKTNVPPTSADPRTWSDYEAQRQAGNPMPGAQGSLGRNPSSTDTHDRDTEPHPPVRAEDDSQSQGSSNKRSRDQGKSIQKHVQKRPKTGVQYSERMPMYEEVLTVKLEKEIMDGR